MKTSGSTDSLRKARDLSREKSEVQLKIEQIVKDKQRIDKQYVQTQEEVKANKDKVRGVMTHGLQVGVNFSDEKAAQKRFDIQVAHKSAEKQLSILNFAHMSCQKRYKLMIAKQTKEISDIEKELKLDTKRLRLQTILWDRSESLVKLYKDAFDDLMNKVETPEPKPSATVKFIKPEITQIDEENEASVKFLSSSILYEKSESSFIRQKSTARFEDGGDIKVSDKADANVPDTSLITSFNEKYNEDLSVVSGHVKSDKGSFFGGTGSVGTVPQK